MKSRVHLFYLGHTNLELGYKLTVAVSNSQFVKPNVPLSMFTFIVSVSSLKYACKLGLLSVHDACKTYPNKTREICCLAERYEEN